jgi:hypothetical protein
MPRTPSCFFIIDDETEMAASVCTLIPSLLQSDEWIAQIDERHRFGHRASIGASSGAGER